MDMTRERISLIFELSAIFLSFQMVLSFASAAVVWAILAGNTRLRYFIKQFSFRDNAILLYCMY